MSATERVAAWIWDWRRLLAALCALVTVLAVWQAGKVGTDNSLRIWFLDDDPQLVAYRSYQERFGNDEVVVIAFTRPDGMASAAGLVLLRRAELGEGPLDVAQHGVAARVELIAGLQAHHDGGGCAVAADQAIAQRPVLEYALPHRRIARADSRGA